MEAQASWERSKIKMSYSSSKLFAWLQEADFYKDLHSEAMEELPNGEGRTWLDFGCGPGLFTRLAATKGYSATGIDRDSSMIREAKKIAKRETSSAVFISGDVFQSRPQGADVVSASSLLAVLDDKVGGFQALLKVVNPGGLLLIVEPTDRMTPHAVDVLIQNGLHGKGIKGLRMWSGARQGRAIDPEIFKAGEGELVVFKPLLGGLVGAWLFQASP